MNTKMKRFLTLMTAVGLAGAAATTANALHPFGINVDLRDANGALVSVTGLPYSPKQTCLTACHNYESHWTTATKTHLNRNGTAQSYDVPYPQHGVSAGYHFQQGKNVPWNATQQDFYHVPEFTSSPGMYGKY